MSDNSRKTPLASALPTVIRQQIGDALELTGKALPCHVESVSGAIVTVSFDIIVPQPAGSTQPQVTLPQVTVPIFGAEYIRLPIKQGCKGVVFPADAYLGGVSGLGGGTANLTQPANLTALVFFPVGNKNWFAVDGDNLVLYSDESCLVQITPTGVQVTGSNGRLSTAQELVAGNGATGTFLSADSKTITVAHGIITSIV